MKLKNIKSLLGAGALSGSEISQLAKYINVPLVRVCSMYQFTTPRRNGCYIILVHPSETANGHWVGLYKFGKNVLYHDSYACPPPEIIQDACKQLNLSWTIKEIQDLRSQHCGQYVIQWLRVVSNSDNPYIATEGYLSLYS